MDGIDLGELGRELFSRLIRKTASDGNYDDTIAECQYKDRKLKEKQGEQAAYLYVDDAFPANKQSLINDWEDDDEEI